MALNRAWRRYEQAHNSDTGDGGSGVARERSAGTARRGRNRKGVKSSVAGRQARQSGESEVDREIRVALAEMGVGA